MEKFNNGEALPLEARLDIYKELLGMYEDKDCYVYGDSGFCFIAKSILMEHLGVQDSVWIDDHPYLLPELWDLRTIENPYERGIYHGGGYWYKNTEERTKALQKAIGIVSSLLNGSGQDNTKA